MNSKKDKIEKNIAAIEKDIALLKEKGVWQKIILRRKGSFSELPFILNDDNVVYSGRIDRIIKENGTYNIYDYKTFPVKEKEIDYLSKEYSVQLNIYKRAVGKLFNTKHIRSFIIFTHTEDVIEV